MNKNSKYTHEQKVEAVLNITEKHMSIAAAAKLLGCSESSATRWLRLYQAHGAAGLLIKNRIYTGNFKVNAVKYMHENHLSASMAAPLLGIPKADQLLSWERIYYEKGVEGLYIERKGQGIKMKNPNKERPKNSDAEGKEDLIAEIQRLRMENAYLKKLNALVQERIQRENGKK